MGKYKPPHKWTKADLALLGKYSDPNVAARIGLHPQTVKAKRIALGIRGHDRIKWGQTEIDLLGRYPDAEVAKLTVRRVENVSKKREELGIAPYNNGKKGAKRKPRNSMNFWPDLNFGH
jgi:hypothetical protein